MYEKGTVPTLAKKTEGASAASRTRLPRCPRREREIDEIPDRYDSASTELPKSEQVVVFADYEVRFGGRSAFEDAVVVGVFLNDVQYFGRGDVMTEREQLFPRILEHVPVPLELIAKHAVGLGHYRVRNVEANASSPRVAEDYRRRAAEMQGPDIDAGIKRSADHCLVRLNGCAAQLGIRL